MWYISGIIVWNSWMQFECIYNDEQTAIVIHFLMQFARQNYSDIMKFKDYTNSACYLRVFDYNNVMMPQRIANLEHAPFPQCRTEFALSGKCLTGKLFWSHWENEMAFFLNGNRQSAASRRARSMRQTQDLLNSFLNATLFMFKPSSYHKVQTQTSTQFAGWQNDCIRYAIEHDYTIVITWRVQELTFTGISKEINVVALQTCKFKW